MEENVGRVRLEVRTKAAMFAWFPFARFHFETGYHYLVQSAGFEFTAVPLPQLVKCWHYRLSHNTWKNVSSSGMDEKKKKIAMVRGGVGWGG